MRPVYIIFDSDSATNAQVLLARHKFSEKLFNRGAQPIVVNIPKEDGKKHGIDDYIVEYGIKAFKELITDESNQEEFAFTERLNYLNTQIAVLNEPSGIIRYKTGQVLSHGDAVLQFKNEKMLARRMKKVEGALTEVIEEVGAYDKWLEWKQRGEVEAKKYIPGADRIIIDDGVRYYNTWQSWGEPKKADVRPFWNWLLDQTLKNALPEHRRWFEQWCAYPIQNPGAKLYSSPLFWGKDQGTGKTMMGLTIKAAYRSNGTEIGDKQLRDERNASLAGKQFAVVNEITGSDRLELISRLRALITQHTMIVNRKYVADYEAEDVLNYFLTSNHKDAIYMSEDERRFFVHEVTGPKLKKIDAERVRLYDQWLKGKLPDRDAGAEMLYYFQHVDLTGFDPTADAPDTSAKTDMKNACKSELARWCAMLKEDPDTCLRMRETILPQSLWTSKMLLKLYDGDRPFKPTSETAMGNALEDAGFKKIGGSTAVTTKFGRRNVWAIRNIDKVLKLGYAEAGRAYEKDWPFGEEPSKIPAQPKYAKGGAK